MPRKRISTKKIKKLITLFTLSKLSDRQLSRALKISPSTVKEYTTFYNNSDLTFEDVIKLKDKEFINVLLPIKKKFHKPSRYSFLIDQFPIIHDRLASEHITLKDIWKKYKQNNPLGYEYSQFAAHYNKWRIESGFPKVCYKLKIPFIPKEDMNVLRKWRGSSNRSKWERGVALLGLYKGSDVTKLSKKLERSCRTIKKWHHTYTTKGIDHLDLRKTKRVDKQIIDKINLKKQRLFELIHESPNLHDINRTSWSLKTLSYAYKKLYGETISTSSISEYIRAERYTFKKARKVLTSNDPEYRTKLNKITSILSNLKPKEKFFSIDEFGPVAIQIRGGRALVHKDQIRTIPQRQISKGSLICTASLELSTNQVTHFYSSKKNTVEMIKLLEILLTIYKTEERIFFSWDAASWHASKKLYEKVEEVNDPEYRKKHNNPFVELAPLPSGAQFLNVVESIFSGMAKAIIHNSDYQSVDECKRAIDRYFSERNRAFIENPKRAGKKIWGEEVVVPIFKESNNCKDPKWR